MSFSAHRPGRFGSGGRIEFEVDGEQPDELYLDDVRAQQAAGEPRDEDLGPDGPEDPYPDTLDLLDDALAMNPTRPVSTPAAEGTDAAHPTIGEWGAVDEPTEDARPVEEPPAAASTRPVRAKRTKRTRERGSGWRRLAVLGGADASVLDQVPTETPRFVQMFFVIAGTALISAISMYFALTTGVRIVAWGALPLAIVWALIIFNLDRFLTSTMRSTHSVGRLIGLAIPRVLMAAVIGIVVAEPLVLQIFHNDIAREVTATNLVQAQSDQDAVADGPEKQALDAASERVAALESQAASGVVAGADTTSASAASAQQTVDDLTAKLAAQQQVIDQARAMYQCELTGQGSGEVAGCSGVAGEGASSTAAKDQLTQAQASYDDIASQLAAAQADLAAAQAAGTSDVAASESQNKQQAKDELPAARQQYEAALAAYDARAAEVAGGNAGAVGLLSQISGLERLSAREPTLAWAHWLIAGLFFMIELLPVLVKVLTSYGEPSLYEQADALRRQVALDRVTARSWRERADIAQNADA
ncbi:DUF4407 domain-containing protein [Microbacterium sp. 4R-513]|uniref:DUF4407 domain-containing protein n=1 Tax=Microbacterium sp. 4R-513 TaxID=2567934 RepID=UPI0013E1485B|nr:DUF4407 domain-containing protein [Microbacterium sp. 4R-513]QIG39264.1 DUF4407 domain-containing protein [Microbacterium sp. 4R-513]